VSWKNTLNSFSKPIVVVAPWPGMTLVSFASVKSFPLMDFSISSKFPSSKSVLPMFILNSVSPVHTTPSWGKWYEVEPLVCPGVWMHSPVIPPREIRSEVAPWPRRVSGSEGFFTGVRIPKDLACLSRFFHQNWKREE